MMRFIFTFFAGLGVIGAVLYAFLGLALVVGWVMNLFKLFGHLPIFDIELVIRLIGLFPVIGGIVGWF